MCFRPRRVTAPYRAVSSAGVAVPVVWSFLTVIDAARQAMKAASRRVPPAASTVARAERKVSPAPTMSMGGATGNPG